MARNYLNGVPATTLAADVTDVALTWTVADGTGYPAVPFAAKCQNEVVEVTATSGVNDVTWTVTRGFDGTTNVLHLSGAVVTDAVIASDFTDAADALHSGTSGELNALTSKAAAVAADVLVIEDSAASFGKKKVLRSGLYPILDSPAGATALGIDAGLVNISVNLTAMGADAAKANTSGLANVAVGYQALYSVVTASYCTAIGTGALALSTSGTQVAVGYRAMFSATTAQYSTCIGYRAGYAPAGVLANATTTGNNATLVGFETGQASATQRNDIVAIGYRSLVDANNTIALGSNAQALHANSVALGDSIVTTAASQVAIGAAHIEATKMTAPGTPAAGDGRVYFDTADGSYKVKFDTGTVVTLATYA